MLDGLECNKMIPWKMNVLLEPECVQLLAVSELQISHLIELRRRQLGASEGVSLRLLAALIVFEVINKIKNEKVILLLLLVLFLLL